MFKVNLSTLLLAVAISFQAVYADDEINSALQKTQDCLRNQNCDAAKTDAGRAAEQKTLEIVGGNAANLQELYDISADIMPMLVQQAGGDSAAMQAILMKAQTDPESFLNSLSPEIQSKIKNIANAVEKSKASGQRP
ncbi:hypothetical protein [Candidatus Methylobacter oryzae]|uniref:Uncharacterized protein n=1 Tax=Candidatus Methylobacter oryzae TaxID=2497749 RepID=A0ABY3C9I6_9GAMM|nr:hypothetical protein [Candidatus Methylobacter oryzae]TRW92717.1 hypothetical protein EKO24_014930 [Candidatus Methylobacter oryzae]